MKILDTNIHISNVKLKIKTNYTIVGGFQLPVTNRHESIFRHDDKVEL